LTPPAAGRSLGLDNVNSRRVVILTGLVATVALAGAGCAMTPTTTVRSTIEQRLLARSLERALAQIDVSAFRGKHVFLDLAALTPDQTWARTFVGAELRQRGVLIVGDASEAEVRILVVAAGLGVDQGETLIGLPATSIPVLSLALPEIALFKWTRHRGTTEIKFYASDRDGHAFETAPTALGESRYSQFTILLIIRYTTDDLDRPPPPSPTPAASPR
jgi:hypothetical protein